MTSDLPRRIAAVDHVRRTDRQGSAAVAALRAPAARHEARPGSASPVAVRQVGRIMFRAMPAAIPAAVQVNPEPAHAIADGADGWSR